MALTHCLQGILVAVAAAHVAGGRVEPGMPLMLHVHQRSRAVHLSAVELATMSFINTTSAVSRFVAGGQADTISGVSQEQLPGLHDLAMPISIVVVTVLLSAGIALSQRLPNEEDPRRSEGTIQEKRSKQAPREAPSLEQAARLQAAISWLRLLVSVALFQLVLQVGLALTTHSLTLLADSAHGTADVVTYAFALYVEWMKSVGHARSSPWVDVLSAMFSVVIVLGTSAVAVFEAVGRLRSGEATSSDSLGVALVGFAAISMATNVGVLAAHFCWYRAPAEEQATATVAPPPTELVCDTCTVSPEPQSTNRGATRWLHAVFHPGCVDSECGASSSSGAAANASMTDNLNVYGALLHLVADVLRSFIVFVTGAMIATGTLADGAKADAVSALFVGACVVLGSLALLRAVVWKAVESWQRSSPSPSEAGNMT